MLLDFFNVAKNFFADEAGALRGGALRSEGDAESLIFEPIFLLLNKNCKKI